MPDTPATQTPRRSKRFQPFVSSALDSAPSNILCEWTSKNPCYTRATTRSDVYDDEWSDELQMETRFYNGFARRKVLPVRRKGRAKRGAREAENVPDAGAAITFAVGDTVLVKGTGKLPSIAVITSMWELCSTDENADDESGTKGMRIRVHWFLRPTELASIRAKREYFENEIYYTISSTATLPPWEILGHCSIKVNKPARAVEKSALAWVASPSKHRTPSRKEAVLSSDAEGSDGDDDVYDGPDSFFCRLAVDSQRGLFYSFDWGKQKRSAMLLDPSMPSRIDGKGKAKVQEDTRDWGDSNAWNVSVDNDLAADDRHRTRGSPRKKREPDSDGESEDDSGDDFRAMDGQPMSDEEMDTAASEEDDHAMGEDEDDGAPKTPTKKRKRRRVSSPVKGTPAKKRGHAVRTQPTPHSKAALRKRGRAPRSPRKMRAAPSQIANDAQRLEFDSLPRDLWVRSLHALHVAARPDALPCREEQYSKVMGHVENLLIEGSGGCVYISGVPGTGKTATVHAVVRELRRMAEAGETSPFTYVEINGLKIPEPTAAYRLLWEGVSGHDTTCDGNLNISSKEALKQLTRHFSGGVRAGPGAHACVVLMDELDQLMTAKQDVVYNFFNWPNIPGSNLVVIAVANTMDLPERVMTGRVRSRLGMTRENFPPYKKDDLIKIVNARLQSAREGLSAEETKKDVIGKDAIALASARVGNVSGDARRVLDICRRTVELVQPMRSTAKADHVGEVTKAMQNSPTAAYLQDCSFHERVMLAALIKCVKREGVEEIRWGEVQNQHMTYIPVLFSNSESDYKPSQAELYNVLDSLVAARALLLEEGLAASRKAESERRVVLNLEQSEVERVLSDLGGKNWKNVLST